MEALGVILAAVCRIAAMALEVTAFFLMVRFLCLLCPKKPIAAFDDAGKALVDGWIAKAVVWWCRLGGKRPRSEVKRLSVGLLWLVGLYLILASLACIQF